MRSCITINLKKDYIVIKINEDADFSNIVWSFNKKLPDLKKLYKNELKTGVTPIKAKINALSKMNFSDVDFELLKTPNNILGIEYAKAVISSGSDIDVCPIIREGAGYNESALSGETPSALAIRTAISEEKLKKVKPFVPPFVYPDLPDKLPDADDLIFYSLLKTPKSDMANGVFRAYWVGGVICVIGQLINDVFSYGLKWGMQSASTATSICLIFIASLLTGLGVYDKIGKYAGAGSIVPITGFANSVVSPAMEFRREGLVMGVGAKMFTLAGPVLVYGIGGSVVVGLATLLLGAIK